MATPALERQNLSVSFRTRKGVVRAVDDLTLAVPRGTVLGFVAPTTWKEIACAKPSGRPALAGPGPPTPTTGRRNWTRANC
jgi:hypothetical protein